MGNSREERVKRLEPFRFRRGESGNPGGRPKRRQWTDALERFGDQPLPEPVRLALKLPRSATWVDAGTVAAFRQVIKGNVQALKEVIDRVEGKAAQRIEVSGPDAGPVDIDLSVLPEKDLRLLIGLLTKAQNRRPKR